MNTDERKISPPSSVLSSRLRRTIPCLTLLSLIPLWISGACGDALSFTVVVLFFGALSLFCIVVPLHRLDATLRIVFMVSSLSGTIFLADFLLRTFASGTIYYRGHTEFLRKDPLYPTLPRYVRDAYSKRTTFGDLAAISGELSDKVERLEIFQTDQRGFRNSPSSTGSPFDVVVVGDSFGMGLGVSQDEHWAALLKKVGHSVYNLSMPATCAAHGAARLTLEIPELPLTPGATIIVPVYTGNDLEECDASVDAILSQGPQSETRALMTRIEDYRSRSPLRQLGMRLVYRFLFADPVIERRTLPNNSSFLFYKPHIKAARLSRAEVENNANFSRMAEALIRLKALAQTHQARLAVVVIPPKEEVYQGLLRGESTAPLPPTTSGFAEAVLSVCLKNDISCLDLTPTISAEAQTAFPSGTLVWWPDDSHWNQLGHRLVARVIAETFLPQYPKS
jgi:hypothetical protein